MRPTKGLDSPSKLAMIPVPPTPTSLAPGFRFHPTDEELVWYYLRRKVTGKSFRFDAISETDIYKLEPWDLPDKSSLKTRDLEWYFFSALDKKYGNGVRMNRATNCGYWKTTGKDRVVRHNSKMVGMKKTLVFHVGRAPGGERTNWVMHEYRLADEESEKTGIPKDVFVLCRVFQKSGLGPPNRDRYAPFIEEEWDNDASVFIPGNEAGDDVFGNVVCVEGIDLERTVKMEDLDEDCPPLSLAAGQPLLLFPHKRLRENQPESGHPNHSELTNMTIQDLSSSTTIAPTTPTPMMMTTTMDESDFSPGFLGFQLLETIERSGPPSPASLTSFLPPYHMLFHDLQNEIQALSTEKATFKMEVMAAQALIGLLHGQIDQLSRENKDLRAGLGGPDALQEAIQL